MKVLFIFMSLLILALFCGNVRQYWTIREGDEVIANLQKALDQKTHCWFEDGNEIWDKDKEK